MAKKKGTTTESGLLFDDFEEAFPLQKKEAVSRTAFDKKFVMNTEALKEKQTSLQSQKSFRSLFAGDFHLGVVTWGFDRTSEIKRSLDVLARTMEETKAGILCITGDVFEHFRYPGDPVTSVASDFFKQIMDLPSSPYVVVVKGNHDWSGMFAWARFAERFIFVNTPQVVSIKDCNILALPYLRRHEMPEGGIDEVALSVWGKFKEEHPNAQGVLAAHCAIEATVPKLKRGEPIISTNCLTDLSGNGIQAFFFGHIHIHEKIEFAPNTYYTGAMIRNTFGEEDSRTGAWVLENNGGEYRTEHVDIPSNRLLTLLYETPEEMKEKLFNELESSSATYARVVVLAPPSEKDSLQRLCDEWNEKDLILKIADFKCEMNSPEVKTDLVATSNEDRGAIPGIPEMWQSFVEERREKEGDDVTEQVIETGLSLLGGESPENVWQKILQSFSPEIENEEQEREEVFDVTEDISSENEETEEMFR